MPSSNSLKKKELEEFEQQPRSCDTEGSMESYDITWDINSSEWDPMRKKHSCKFLFLSQIGILLFEYIYIYI